MLAKIKDFTSVIANISQVVLVCVAVFGYFYTVIPVYQKELLAETVAEQQREISVIEQKNASIEQEILNNNTMLEEQKKLVVERQGEIEGLKVTVAALKSEHDSLSLNNELLGKKVSALSEEIISKRRALENLQTKLATNYRSVFVENMSSCSLISMLRGYIIVEKDFEIKSIDDINKYKKSINSPFVIIDQCLANYHNNYIEAYSNVPNYEKKRLANEFFMKLRKRHDLKTPFFDEKAVQSAINDMQVKLNSMQGKATDWEKYQQKKVIEYECSRKIFKLTSEFKDKDFFRVSEFWTHQ